MEKGRGNIRAGTRGDRRVENDSSILNVPSGFMVSSPKFHCQAKLHDQYDVVKDRYNIVNNGIYSMSAQHVVDGRLGYPRVVQADPYGRTRFIM